MATKLQHLLRPLPRSLETEDVLAAFRRIAKRRWGEHVPLEPVRWANGVLTVTCPSALWRTEAVYAADTIRRELTEELPTLTLRRVSVVLL